MAISVVASTAAAANNPLSGNFALPGSWAQNDLALFWWYGRSVGKTFTDASGGNLTILYNNAATNGVLVIATRVLQSSDLATNMDWTSASVTNGNACYGTLILRGVDLTTPIEANSGTPASNTNQINPNPPAVTVATANACVVTIFGKNNDYAASVTAPASYTAAGTIQDTTGTNASGGCAYRLNVSAGTEDPAVWTLGGAATDDGRTWTCSVKAAVAAEMAASVALAVTVPPAALTTAITLAATVAVAITASGELSDSAAGGGAVTVVDTPTTSGAGVGTSLTFSHTTGATAAGLFVGVVTESNVTTSSVTFHGDALTELWDLQSTGVISSAGYLMVAPDIGTFDVVVTLSGSTSSMAGAVSLAGLDQTTPTRTATTGSDGASGPTVTVTSVAGDLVIDCAGTYDTSIAVGADQTAIIEVDNAGGGSRSWGISTETATGTSTTMAWTGGTFNVNGAVALVAAPTGPVGAEFDADILLAVTTAGTLTTAIELTAAPTLAVTTAGQLTTAITLAASPALSVTTAAALTTEIRLAAVATVQITTTADLTAVSPILLEGTAALAITTSAPLTTAITLAAGITVTGTASGSLTTAIQMAGATTVQVTTSANLTVEVSLAGAAALQITATADLTTYTALAGTAALTIETAADLFAETPPMVGTATLTIVTAADLTTELHLAGEALLVILAQGILGSIPPSIVNPSVRVVKPGRTTQPIPAGRAGVVTGAGRTVGNGTGPRTAAPVRSSRRTLEAIE